MSQQPPPAQPESQPPPQSQDDGFQPRTTPVFEPAHRERTRGRRWFITSAVVAVLLGIVVGVWAAVLAAQQDLREHPADGLRAGAASVGAPLIDLHLGSH